MAININVQVARSVPRINEDGLTLVIFKNARKLAGVTDTIVSVNTLQDLYTNFGDSTDISTLAVAKELYVAEYLVRAGVNLLCYSTATVGSIASADITNIEDVEVLGYKMILSPYNFLDDDSNQEALLLSFAKDNDVQLFMDLDPDIEASDAEDVITALGTTVSPKLELFVNSGLPNFTSQYSNTLPSDFDASDNFFGIPASAVVVARKASVLKSETPWLPVAGETYGLVNEFTKIYRRLSTKQKNDLQALNLNVLFTKTGIGNLLVSQNTLADSTNSANPLIRSHVVTSALYIKRILRREAERLLFAPNNIKTWNQFSLKATSLFNRLVELDGIEDFSVQIGRGITMTAQDIADGKLKVVVTFLPVRVIEEITFNIVIQETEDAYVVEFEGGDL